MESVRTGYRERVDYAAEKAMNNSEIRRIINQFAEEALYCSSNKAARELDARIGAFEREHHCEALVETIFIETGAGDALGDMLINYDDNAVSTMPKF